jgi:HEAT repeat protein
MPFDVEVITMAGGPLAVVQGIDCDWSILRFKLALQEELPKDKQGMLLKLFYNGELLSDEQTMASVQDSPLVAVFESLGSEHLEDLSSCDARKRCAAAEALGKLGTPAAPHATRLAVLVRDKYGHVKSAAVTALKSIGAAGGPYVVSLLYSDDCHEQCAGAEALVVMGVQTDYVTEIAELLQSSNPQVRACAVKVLASMGASAASQIAKLVALLRNSKVQTREYIPQAISHIGVPAIPYVAQLLSDQDANVRSQAALILGRLGPSAAHHAADLEGLLQDPEDQVQVSAIQGLVGMNVLEPLINHADKSIQDKGMKALQDSCKALQDSCADVAKPLSGSTLRCEPKPPSGPKPKRPRPMSQGKIAGKLTPQLKSKAKFNLFVPPLEQQRVAVFS